jgi:glycosyltransferase involved in cell wall biosynthesis
LLDRCVFHRYQAFACISIGVLESFSAWLPQYRAKTRLIYNGIDLSAFTPGEKSTDKRKKLVITSVGRLVSVKNHRLVLSALEDLQDINLQYWIVGDGPLKDDLAEQVKNSGLDGRVRFFGYQEDIAPILANSDIFVLPSLYEGFGLAAVEAMAMGLPVIASNVEGIREIIGEQLCCGYLVDPTDHKKLAELIRELAASPELRQDMGARALERASLYSIEKTCDDYLDLYKQILNNTR